MTQAWNKNLLKGTRNGDWMLIRMSLDNGADINFLDCQETALSIAVSLNYVKIVKYLLKSGAKTDIPIEKPPLITATVQRNLEIVKLFHKFAYLTAEDVNSRSALSWASSEGGPLITKYLAKKAKSLINRLDKNGISPLSYATINGNFEIVHYLVKKTATVDSEEDVTPLHWACGGHNLEIVKLFVRKGADLEKRDRFGNTALHYATGWAKQRVLVEEDHELPLRWALSGGSFEIIKFLVESGANVNAINKNGESPSFVAMRHQHDKVVAFLEQNGAVEL